MRRRLLTGGVHRPEALSLPRLHHNSMYAPRSAASRGAANRRHFLLRLARGFGYGPAGGAAPFRYRRAILLTVGLGSPLAIWSRRARRSTPSPCLTPPPPPPPPAAAPS